MAKICSIFEISTKLIKLCGCWQNLNTNKSPILSRFYKIYGYILLISYIYMAVSIFDEFINLWIKKNNKKAAVDSIPILIEAVMVICRILVFRNRKFQILILYINSREKELFSREKKEVQEIYKEYAKFAQKVGKIIICGISSGLLILILTTSGPVLLGIADPNNKPQMLTTNFHFDQNEYYIAASILHCYLSALGVIFYAMEISEYISLVLFVQAELKILQYKFRNFDYFRGEQTDITFLIELIKYHQKIIKFMNILNAGLKNLLFLEFLTTSLIIATNAYQLINVSLVNLSEKAFAVFFLPTVTLQWLGFTWPANSIKVESINVSFAAYECPWYKKSVEFQKTILIIIMRSQKPLVLTFGSYSAVTTESFLNVLNASYSYVTVMKKEASKN